MYDDINEDDKGDSLGELDRVSAVEAHQEKEKVVMAMVP